MNNEDDDFTKTIEDLYDAIVGVGVEAEAMVKVMRAYVIHETGVDPLAGTGYDGEDPEPPAWTWP